jgi:dimeric dUTPase (all-alpha-NTP-PPase superfamily)
MNLSKLFHMQRQLEDRIMMEKGLVGQDLLPKKIIALQVEMGELANEIRFFKFWSQDQTPRTKVPKRPTMNYEDIEWTNRVLEEYADALHLGLSIGIELEWDMEQASIFPRRRADLTEQFQALFYYSSRLLSDKWLDFMDLFMGLGEMLGFTWEEIEQAYFEKNAVNHTRQEQGY